jgi:hypothetical protein
MVSFLTFRPNSPSPFISCKVSLQFAYYRFFIIGCFRIFTETLCHAPQSIFRVNIMKFGAQTSRFNSTPNCCDIYFSPAEFSLRFSIHPCTSLSHSQRQSNSTRVIYGWNSWMTFATKPLGVNPIRPPGDRIQVEQYVQMINGFCIAEFEEKKRGHFPSGHSSRKKPALMSCLDLHLVPCSFRPWWATCFVAICCVCSLVYVV